MFICIKCFILLNKVAFVVKRLSANNSKAYFMSQGVNERKKDPEN